MMNLPKPLSILICHQIPPNMDSKFGEEDSGRLSTQKEQPQPVLEQPQYLSKVLLLLETPETEM